MISANTEDSTGWQDGLHQWYSTQAESTTFIREPLQQADRVACNKETLVNLPPAFEDYVVTLSFATKNGVGIQFPNMPNSLYLSAPFSVPDPLIMFKPLFMPEIFSISKHLSMPWPLSMSELSSDFPWEICIQNQTWIWNQIYKIAWHYIWTSIWNQNWIRVLGQKNK